MPGKVYLIGAGPGDPGLITEKGRRVIAKADVIVYDYLANPRFLALTREDAEKIYVGKKGGDHTLSQEGINQLLVEKAKEGKTVARLKGGDPFLFGRGGEEAEVLVEHGIPFEIVPGVTSAIAAPAYAGIPVTHREHTSTFTMVTGHEDPTKEDSAIDWEALARIGTIAFLMGMKNLPRICENLLRHGKPEDTPVAVVRWGTTPRQKVVVGNLGNIVAKVEEAKLGPPSIILVGEVVKLREKLNWFETKPLFGKRIVVTRTRAQASQLVESLEECGAECLEIPTIKIVPPDSFEPLEQAIEQIETYDWLIFTSVNGVQVFFERLFARGKDARALANTKVAAIGVATAELIKKYGLLVDLLPQEFRAEGLLEALLKEELAGKKVLIPRALEAREILPEKLREAGAEVEVVPAYQTILPEEEATRLKKELEQGVDVITFTSSSTAKNLLKMLGDEARSLLSEVVLASIGPITTETLKKAGFTPQVEAKEYTIPGLVKAILEYFRA
ncbi:uroporphyrin-III C-methyltransferase [Thermodesulfatator indicus DSM 15286]|uniref:uroporphyrinogen-III C-methyltransferase n=1 Tax=Thermodesulfatator indicus (strain DSM 15286 / JCM 11887 / CIR29812) TaxID=667014 RepID=F8ACV9_THEID|nr:uroporphyrinogen-III C-methyltransferase [Thermodesulfatator indicus]AEH44750.1 uroporphyrin-III C-methyltransferase [Thermodesulfatator indicus DSM 15286]